MVFEGLDAGDETRRNGDYVGFDTPDTEGTALSGVTIPRGVPVTSDASGVLAESTATGDDIAGILANYNVSGDTGKEVIDGTANVKMRGECLADLTDFSPTVGTYLDGNGDVYVVENVRGDIYRVQVR